MKKELEYTHTRLEIPSVATLYVAVNEVKTVVEVITPMIILDNEKVCCETLLPLDKGGFKELKEYFESIHGKKLKKIDIDKMNILCCREIPNLEDDLVFVTLEECLVGEDIMYTITLTEKSPTGGSHTIELNKESYICLSAYTRR